MYFRNIFLVLYLIELLLILIYRFYFGVKKIFYIRHLLDLFSILWIYQHTLISLKKQDAKQDIFLFMIWFLKGLGPLTVYLFSYILSGQRFLRSFMVFKMLRQPLDKSDKESHSKPILYTILFLLNTPRMILDTSIFASLCSISKLGTEFDPISYAGQDRYITKLANMHAMIREGRIGLLYSSFVYHPKCYQLSLLISKSWTFYIYFIGVDCIILQILPLGMEVANMVLIIKQVQKSNKFRRQANAILINLLTRKFITIIVEISWG